MFTGRCPARRRSGEIYPFCSTSRPPPRLPSDGEGRCKEAVFPGRRPPLRRALARGRARRGLRLAGRRPAGCRACAGSKRRSLPPGRRKLRARRHRARRMRRRDYPCLQQAFGNIAYRRGRKGGARALRRADRSEPARQDGLSPDRAHDRLGGVRPLRRQRRTTFALGSATCASGYYHGILERAFVGVNTKTKLVDVARELCAGSGIRRRGFLDYQCQHGLGHGLMIQTGYDLPLALSTCSRLATGWDDVVLHRRRVHGERDDALRLSLAWLEDDDPLYPCGRVALRNRRSCYLRAAVRVISFHGNDFAKAAAACDALAPRWAQACFRGYGRDAVNEARYSPAKIISLCRLADDNRDDCLYGAARTVGDGEGSEGVRRAAKLCRMAPTSERDACFSGVGIIVGLLYPTNATRQRAASTSRAALRLPVQGRRSPRSSRTEREPGGNGAGLPEEGHPRRAGVRGLARGRARVRCSER